MNKFRQFFRKIFGRITGFSIPFFGISWTPIDFKKTEKMKKLRSDAFVLGNSLISNINAVTEHPRRTNTVQDLWKAIDGLLRNLGIPPTVIPGKHKILDADEALMETISLAQSLRESISARNDSYVGSAFWMGVISMLAGQFLQNPDLVSKAVPLIKELKSIAKECSINSKIMDSYISDLQSGDQQRLLNAIMPFTKAVSDALST